MLQQILEASGLDSASTAGLLGVNSEVFAEWAAGQRTIPESMLPLLSAVLGVNKRLLRLSPKQAKSTQADITPAIWYKFRGPRVADSDRECALLIRELGFYMHELEVVTGRRALGWAPLFEDIRRTTDQQAPPGEQGRQAARNFRQSTSLDQGATGIGEVFRGHLRNLGLLVVESPITGSNLEGCSFYVGASVADRPCIFANVYQTTWFRRNMILMHELAHAIFDAESCGASLDFVEPETTLDLSEQRAEAFAREALLPEEVLRHAAQKRGLKWDSADPQGLAQLVADTHVEPAVIALGALDAGFIDADSARRLRELDIARILPSLTERALSAKDFIASRATDAETWIAKRTTASPLR
jgi:Zn-dependent peptidase ImmA (M78 family)